MIFAAQDEEGETDLNQPPEHYIERARALNQVPNTLCNYLIYVITCRKEIGWTHFFNSLLCFRVCGLPNYKCAPCVLWNTHQGKWLTNYLI